MKTLVDREDLVFSPPQLGCVLCLPGLPGGDSKIYDRSPYGNMGTIIGATWTKLPSGLWCLSFDGNDDYVNCGNSPCFDISNNLTLETWLNMAELSSDNRAILRKSENYVIDASYSKIRFFIFDTGASNTIAEISQTSDMVDRWMHVVGTYKDRVVTLYVDGILEDTETTTGGDGLIEVTTSDVTVGSWGTGSYFKGKISLTRIYNRALSALEIQNHFNHEKHLFGVW